MEGSLELWGKETVGEHVIGCLAVGWIVGLGRFGGQDERCG